MTRPSFSDYGTYDESAYPQLWEGLVAAWCPSLGPTGERLHNLSRYNNWGTLTNMDPAHPKPGNGKQQSEQAVSDPPKAGCQ